MTDTKRLVPHEHPQLPAVRAPSIPDFRSSSGEIAFTRRSGAVKDAAYSRALADLIRAQKEQVDAARELSDARFEFAVALSKWQHLDEVCQHEYQKGLLTRTSALKVLALDLETREINARIARDQAMLMLQAYQPQPQSPAPQSNPPVTPPLASTPVGLEPNEIEDLVRASLPEVTPETLRTLLLLLEGRLAEKKA